ncbi:type II toxin-antitoxin system RelE/ParE family toxin [Acinetobacter baumannii]|uniref:type II toxin-antitoxin system RelE/ParE family toxin n=1 Tax=Acinetobacter calcoaceticus/baumannii complex TaxID=909768 RepID=UPI001C2267E7|nr:type II toxin-antitoxin system RelE/ParE family toxin [Acinetobacter pittii]QXA08335.1 type II toxin-antitoxin system RelE/ParE family toxin [Acinetobacter pittii]
MYEIKTTETFDEWFDSLRDTQGKARINARLRRVELGNFGDAEPVGENVSELRFFFGPGYRVYFIQEGDEIIVLLAGGDKSSQQKDIDKAIELAKEIRGES